MHDTQTAATGPPAPAAPSPIRNPVVRRVIISDLISRLGSRMSYLALPWFVLITSHSITRMGLVFGVELLPVAVLGIPSASVIERLGIRRTVVIGDTAQAILIALVPGLYLLKVLSFWAILVIVAAVGSVAAPYTAAQRLLLPEALGDDEVAVTTGNALIEASTWGTQLAGPAIAGLLIAVIGAMNVLWIDAGTFVISAVVLYGLPRPAADLSGAAASPGLLAGARYALRDSALARLIVAATGYGIFIPFVLIALPVTADIRFGANPKVAGWLLAAWGGGALAGTFVVMPAVQRIPPLRLGALAGIGMAVPLWFLPIRQPVLSIAAIMLISGLFIPMLNAPAFALLTTRPPAELRAQVMTFFVTANLLAGPVAYVAAGPLFAHFGLAPVLIGVAIGVTLCAGLLFTFLRPAAAGQDDAGPVIKEPA
jgi:MFS family permease